MRCNHCGIHFDDSEMKCPMCGERTGTKGRLSETGHTTLDTPMRTRENTDYSAQSKARKPSETKPIQEKKKRSSFKTVVTLLVLLFAGRNVIGNVLDHVEDLVQKELAVPVSSATEESETVTALEAVTGDWALAFADGRQAALKIQKNSIYAMAYENGGKQVQEQGDVWIEQQEEEGMYYPEGYSEKSAVCYMMVLSPHLDEQTAAKMEDEDLSPEKIFVMYQSYDDPDTAILYYSGGGEGSGVFTQGEIQMHRNAKT